MVISMLVLYFIGMARDNISPIQRTETKEDENGFLGLSLRTFREVLSGHAQGRQ